MEGSFRVEISNEGARTLLSLSGELDVSSSSTLEQELERLGDTQLVVADLRALEFIDSTGLGVLVKTHQRLLQAGGELTLVEGEGQVKRLLDLTGLTEQLRIVTELDQALGEAEPHGAA